MACPGARSVIRLLNSIVDVCLVYGIDESSTRELEVTEEGDIHSCYEGLLQRDIKIRFLQILTPGQTYPERPSHPPSSSPPSASPSPEDSITTVHSKKFNVEDLGLTWETVETVHWFIFPEGPQLYEKDLEPSVVPMTLTNIDGARSYTAGLRFSRPYFIQKPKNGHYYTLIPWNVGMQPPANSRLVYLPTCLVFISKHPYFQFMKDSLSGFHRLITSDDDVQVDFWKALREYTERLFLIPAPPQGVLAVEFQLPAFSSNLIVRPPRGNQYLDIRLHYPFLCLSEDSVLQVISALLTEQRIIFLSSLYPMLTYVIQCFLAYISPFDWRHPCVPILPQQLVEYLEAPGTNIMGCHSLIADTPDFQQIDDVVIVDLDNGVVTCRLHDPPTLPRLPQNAMETFKMRHAQLTKRNFAIEEMIRLSHMSTEELERERAGFDRLSDEMLSKIFLELMVNVYNHVTEKLLHSRIEYEEAVKEMAPEDQEFYKYARNTDMFSAFYQSRKLYQRDDFTLLAERIKKFQRRSVSDDEYYSLSPSCLRPSSYSNSSLPISGSPRQSRPSFNTAPASYRTPGVSTSYPTSSPFATPPVPEDSILPQRSSPLAFILPAWAPHPSELVCLELPPLGGKIADRAAFVTDVIKSLSELMQNKQVKAQCVYLRAFYLICQGEFIEALDYFFDTLQRLEIQLMPDNKTILEVVSYLSDEQCEQLKSKSYYRLVCPKKTGIQPNPRKQATVTYNLINIEKKMPKKPLALNEFLKIVNQNAIATDAESASNLHRVLSQGRTTNIAPDTFRAFYEAWKLVLQENESIDLQVELERADKGCGKVRERVLAVSGQIRTNFSIQSQLVLTTYRLLVVTSFKTSVMADLHQAIRFEKSDLQLGILGAKTPCITVERLDKKKGENRHDNTVERMGRLTRRARGLGQEQEVYMGFQNVMERENWYRMVLEVQRGWKFSQSRKDLGVMETAECHVILYNAVNQSSLLDRYNHQQRIKLTAKLLSFQSKDISEVSKFTVEALQYRINPCLHETEKQTVESLLYIPPSDQFDGSQGKLWIGLGNGRIKVYDMDVRCFESDIKITESRHGKSVRLSCLLLVGQHVWVGSFSKNIHILDAETVCHVSQLSYLEDAPRDLALSQTEPKLVWSLLLNGLLLAWDPETRTRVVKMQVPMSDDHTCTCTCFTIWREFIWVGTNRGTIAVMHSGEGTCVQEIFFPGGRKRQVEIKHLALSSEDEVWCSVYSIPRSEDSTFIAVFDPDTREKKMQYTQLDNRVSIILPVNNTMWCGTKSGKIYIFHAKTYAEGKGMPKVLSAHDDFIRTMTMTDISLVVSGSGSNDGYAAVWKTIDLP